MSDVRPSVLFSGKDVNSFISLISHMLLFEGNATIFTDMLHALTCTIDVFPRFVRVTILGIEATFGQCFYAFSDG